MPDLLPMLGSVIGSISSGAAELAPILGAASSGVGLIENIFGGKSTGGAAPATVPKEATSTITGTAVAPGTSPTDYTNSQNAYWRQLISGLGIPGDQIPTNIQQDIAKQASLIGG